MLAVLAAAQAKQQTSSTDDASLSSRGRILQTTGTHDLARIQVHAPNGKSEILMGDRDSQERVSFQKAPAAEGGEFTLSRGGRVAPCHTSNAMPS